MVCLMLRSQGKVWRRKARWPTDFLMTKPQLKLFWEMVVTAHPFCNLDSRHRQVGPYCVCVYFLTHHIIKYSMYNSRADKNEITRLELDYLYCEEPNKLSACEQICERQGTGSWAWTRWCCSSRPLLISVKYWYGIGVEGGPGLWSFFMCLDPDQEARLQAGERVQITPFCVSFLRGVVTKPGPLTPYFSREADSVPLTLV